MITAAIFGADGGVRNLIQTYDVSRLNARLRRGETWREVSEECLTEQAPVPPLETLEPPDDLVEPA